MRAVTAGSQSHVPAEPQLPIEDLPIHLDSRVGSLGDLRAALESNDQRLIIWDTHSGTTPDLELDVQRFGDLRTLLKGKEQPLVVFLNACTTPTDLQPVLSAFDRDGILATSRIVLVGDPKQATAANSPEVAITPEIVGRIRGIPQLYVGMAQKSTSPVTSADTGAPFVDQFTISTLALFDPFTASAKPVPTLTSAGTTFRIRLTIDLDRIPNLRTDLLRLVDGILASLRLMLVLVLASLTRHPNVRNFVLVLVAACRHYGHRGEPDDHLLPTHRSISVVRGELVLAA